MYPKRNLLSIILLCIICVIVIFFTSCSKYDWSEDKTKGENGGDQGTGQNRMLPLSVVPDTNDSIATYNSPIIDY